MSSGGGILLVDDEPIATKLAKAILAPLGVELHAVSTGEAAIEYVRTRPPRTVVLDLVLPDMSGLDVLESILGLRSDMPVVMLTGRADVATAVRALRKGAFDYLLKPVDHEELVVSVQRALERERLLGEVHELREEVRTAFLVSKMGPSAEVAALVQRINQVAASSMSVLVLGETGSGKELVAQAIHKASGRAERPFIPVDCGAIPETLLESELFGHEEGAFTGARKRQKGQFAHAEGGTLFLDEVGNLSPPNQAKLLRVLEERKLRPLGGGRSIDVDVRIVAATNERLAQRVRQDQFRQDLYYRLAEYTIRVPPLRSRRGDIPHLARRFCEEAARELGKAISTLEPAAITALQQYDWPGNARELRNAIRQAVLACSGSTLVREHLPPFDTSSLLPPPLPASTPPPEIATPVVEGPVHGGGGLLADELEGKSLKEIAEEAASAAERIALARTLARTGGNRAETARLLQTDVKTLYRKLKRYQLDS